MAKKTFDEWMKDVNAVIQSKFGLTSDDLPDVNYRSMYDDGISAKSAAAKAIRVAKE